MLQKLKQIHFMFYIGLIFIFFPIAGVLNGDYPLLLLLWTGIFVAAYFCILIDENQLRRWISWWILLVYIAYTSIFLNQGFIWYVFYLSNLLNYTFKDFSFTSPRYITYFGLQFFILTIFYVRNPQELSNFLFILIVLIFIDLLSISYRRMQILEEIEKEKRQQNAQINLLLAENERNRIGRDLHDSLGHTFAMLSLKAELAQQLLQMQEYSRLDKELGEMQTISKQSMMDVRKIIDNLKTHTLNEELLTIQHMLEMTGVEVALDNQLNTASILPNMQSSLSMILLELATNIIKHAQAKHCKIRLFMKAEQIILEVEDDGLGFRELTGEELHSIRERLINLTGQIEIVNKSRPTTIRITLPYERKEK